MAEGLPIVLVTGTSSGVGLELVKLLRELPYRVVATARVASLGILNEHGLHPDEKLLIKALDVCELSSHKGVIQEVQKQWGPVDILVNNAGISYRGALEHMSVLDEERQMTVNYLGPMSLVREVLPEMRKRKSGRIINVSSVGGMMAMPTMGSYSASKWALEGASESLWYELRPWDIRVSLIQPGFIRSDSFRRVNFPVGYEDSSTWGPYRQHYLNMGRFVERLMGLSFSSSNDVARVIVKTLGKSKPKLRVAATMDARVFYLMRRFLPRVFYHRFLYECLPGKSKWGCDESTKP
jgi:short-subunit dehydrogenase